MMTLTSITEDLLNSQQIADALGVCKRAANKRANKEHWQFEETTGLGGKRKLFPFASLPKTVQTKVLIKFPAATVETVSSSNEQSPFTYDKAEIWANYDKKTAAQKAKAQAHLDILNQVMALVDNGFDMRKAMQTVAIANNISWRSIQNWYYGKGPKRGVKDYERVDWLAALVPMHVGNTQKAKLSDEAWELFKADYLRLEKPSASACYERLKRAAKEHNWTIPGLRTLQRKIDQIPRAVRVLKREGEIALMTLYPAQERTVRELHALQWINGDGYQHNVFVKWPDGEIKRPKTWVWQDIYSRKILAFRTDTSEHTDLIRNSFGDLVEEYGIPHEVTIDNTRAAANKWMTGGVPNRYRFKVKEDDPLGLFPSLGMKVHWTTVLLGKGHGQAKPIERAFGVGGVGEVVDKHPRLAGAFTGHNTTAKPENYGSDAIPLETFLEVLVSEIAAFNARTERRTEICDGKLSYDDAFNASYEVSPIQKATPEQCRLWLLTAEAIRVQKDGTFSLGSGGGTGRGKNRYMAAELVDHASKKVVVRFDPQNLHGEVHAYTLDGRYICPASCIDATGFGDTEAARSFNRARKQFIKATKEQSKAEVTMSAIDVADRIPLAAQAESPDAKVVRPMRPIAAMNRPESVSTITEQQAAEIAQFQQNFEPQEVVQLPNMADPNQAYKYWVRVGQRIENGEVVSIDERTRYQRYIASSSYKQMREFYADFEAQGFNV